MKTLTKIGAACVGGAGAYGLLIKPRRNHPGWSALSGVRYAHRGLHDREQGVPENSMAAFRRAVEHGFGAELDVHLMADGALAVVHDSDLTRVCGRQVCIEDLTAGDLPDYPLMGTEEAIPLLEDVLALFPPGGAPAAEAAVSGRDPGPAQRGLSEEPGGGEPVPSRPVCAHQSAHLRRHRAGFHRLQVAGSGQFLFAADEKAVSRP